jgi:hypothetical protein
MAPKTPLLTAGTTNLKPPKAPYRGKPITTQDKIKMAEYKKYKATRNVPREAPHSTLAESEEEEEKDETDPKTKKAKPKSLPPPSESRSLLKPKSVGVTKKSSRRDPPLTTLAKIRAADAKFMAKDPYAAAKKKQLAALKRNGLTATMKRAGRVRPPALMGVLASHDASSKRSASQKTSGRGVLFRRTAKATKIQQQKRDELLDRNASMRYLWNDPDVQRVVADVKNNKTRLVRLLNQEKHLLEKFTALIQVGLLPDPSGLDLTISDLPENTIKPFNFSTLPRSVQTRIIKFATVEANLFVYPCNTTGREQPDLSITSRQLRALVLPIYYGNNVFAVDMSPLPRKQNAMVELGSFSKWPYEVERGGWLGHIREWVFNYAPIVAAGEDDKSLMLHVSFEKLVSGRWGASIEVHREASCIRTTTPLCVIKQTPTWVIEAVISVCDGAAKSTDGSGGHGISAQMIVGLATAIQSRVEELVEQRCERFGGIV